MTVQMPDLAVNCTQLTIAEEVHTSPFEADEHEWPRPSRRPTADSYVAIAACTADLRCDGTIWIGLNSQFAIAGSSCQGNAKVSDF